MTQFTPVTYPARIFSECSQYDHLQDELTTEALGQVQHCIHSKNISCQEILYCFPSAPSGYYQITAPNGSLVQVYCDMERTNCGGEGGWTRVAYVNMSQSGATCPQGLTRRTLSGLTLCGRMDGNYVATTPFGGGCQSTVFSTLGLSYSQVCGQLRGYHFGQPNAFWASSYQNPPLPIDNAYVDGASITYGSGPRKHIWTYANSAYLPNEYGCPCSAGNELAPPPYIGSSYYCETGDSANDTLWDGQQCFGIQNSCCTHPNMPWFNKTLGETTTEDIELRVCGDEIATNEDAPLQVIELFVH